jgi:hypothetical protein
VTNNRVLFIKSSNFEFKMLFEITYQELQHTKLIEDTNQVFLEITKYIETSNGGRENKKFTRFKFESKDSAMSLENKINYAKANYDESFYNLPNYHDDG